MILKKQQLSSMRQEDSPLLATKQLQQSFKIGKTINVPNVVAILDFKIGETKKLFHGYSESEPNVP